jgi:outer membrane autotransporter protein
MDCGLNYSNIGPVTNGYGCFRPQQVQAWGRVWGGWNNNDGDVNAPAYDDNQFGIWGGLDYAISDTWVFGVAGGWFDSNMDFASWGGVSGGTIDYDGGQIALYGAWDTSVWYDRAIVSAGFYSAESHRDFAFRAPVVDPSGNPDSDAVAFYNEVGRRFGVGTGMTLTPFFGISVADAEFDNFTENDPHKTGAALRVSLDDANSVASLVGVRFNGTWGAFRPQVALGWEHEFGDTFQTVNLSFADAPSGSNFRVIGTDLGEDALVVDAGASYALGAASDLSVRYIGRFLEDYDAQSVMGRWTYKWGAVPVAAPPPQAVPLKLGG